MAEAAQRVGFFKVPGILLLRLMSRCNEKCLFCMVADEIAESDDVSYSEALAHIEKQPKETLIEFFGGEPTIYPRFLDLLRFARGRGHRCSIATNARVFHSEKFVKSVAELGASEIYVRTSLYGDTAELHDHYTAVPGSYQQTVRGVHNLVAAGFRCQVNIVILKENFEALETMVRQIKSWGVPWIKFGMLMFVDTCYSHAVSLASVEPHLRGAITLAESLGLRVTVEKTPVCTIGGRLDLMSTEREIYGGERLYDDSGPCGGCLVRRWCDGLDPGYVHHFGFAGINRLDSVPAAAINGSVQGIPAPELLKTYCVEISDKQLDEETIAALGGVLNQVETCHGRLAIFPTRYLSAPQTLSAVPTTT